MSAEQEREAKYAVEGEWLVEVVNEHTCGTSADGYYGAHEPGCGLEPVAKVADLLDALAARTEQADEQPPRPEPGKDEDGYPCVPEGWGAVVMGTNADTQEVEVLTGWTAEGTFVQYAPTEAIVKVCIEALQEAHGG